ncbi:hypothetical protein [Nonomuraea sp. NPDC048901]
MTVRKDRAEKGLSERLMAELVRTATPLDDEPTRPRRVSEEDVEDES